eukprot:2544476-Pleurochrysis_carterae.AAC.2
MAPAEDGYDNATTMALTAPAAPPRAAADDGHESLDNIAYSVSGASGAVLAESYPTVDEGNDPSDANPAAGTIMSTKEQVEVVGALSGYPAQSFALQDVTSSSPPAESPDEKPVSHMNPQAKSTTDAPLQDNEEALAVPTNSASPNELHHGAVNDSTALPPDEALSSDWISLSKALPVSRNGDESAKRKALFDKVMRHRSSLADE